MNRKWIASVTCSLAMIALIAVSPASARRKHHKSAPVIVLNATGQQLETQYASQLKTLRAEIQKDVPKVDPQKMVAFQKARENVEAANLAVKKAQAAFSGINKYRGLVGHAHWWINDAQKRIDKAKAQLKHAATDNDRKALEQIIAKQTARRDAGKKALKDWTASLVMAEKDEAKLNAVLKAAQDKLDKAKGEALQAFKSLNVGTVLASDKLDTQLTKFEVLSQATPRGLAAFAQQGKTQQVLVEKMLANTDLMKQMLIADGPSKNRYGQAMQIYTDIQKMDPKASSGTLQRLAMAVALVHAAPQKQRNRKDDTTGPSIVDPIKRYQAYAAAYQANELDPAFKNLTTWDYTFVVDSDAPNETLAWGRQMLRNYRPDEISTNDYRWRYAKAVKTEVQYGSKNNKYDLPSLQFYQNIIKDGGVCGRRAWFGGFALRSFGIPVIRRPQHGHAALAHWTPNGWVVNFGAGWGTGFTHLQRYPKDLDFLASTQARATGEPFVQVRRAQWIGDAMGEKPVYSFYGKETPGLWHTMSLYQRKEIIAKAKAKTLEAVGTDIAEANQSKKKDVLHAVKFTAADRKITVNSKGVIHIPASACIKPTGNTQKIRFMNSFLGGLQLHYSRLGPEETFEYAVDVPQTGKYNLSIRVVTTSQSQHLMVTVNGSKNSTDIALPYTIGMWEKTQPVSIELVKGHNVLSFTRGKQSTMLRGITLKDFTLTPKY